VRNVTKGWSLIMGMFLHSTYLKTNTGDAVVVREYDYSTGTPIPKLTVIENPQRRFGITKEKYRTHKFKKEFEYLDKLDLFTVPNHQLELELCKQTKGYYPKRRESLSELCNNPYVYGADIHIETLIKNSYMEGFAASGHKPVELKTGFLDVETSVSEKNYRELIVMSVTHENTIYTAIHKDVFVVKCPTTGDLIPGNIDELRRLSNSILEPNIDDAFNRSKALKRMQDKKVFKSEYFVGNTQTEMIKWIFSHIHNNKTDFMGIWNIDYDLNVIYESLTKENKETDRDVIKDVFCSPDLQDKFKFVRYAQDRKEVDHITQKWHWLHCTSYTQMYDAMCLYSSLRTVSGKEVSYKLDHILKKNGMGGKLTFPNLPNLENLSSIGWHRAMQAEYIYEYIVYNQWDVISLQLMEWQNKDATSMYLLSEQTSLSKYTRQTRKAADKTYFRWLKDGKMLASTGSDMTTEFDIKIPAIGGAVLRPEQMVGGLNLFEEDPTRTTMIDAYVNDIDFTGMYPNTGIGCNVSKQTKLNTVYAITDKDNNTLSVERLFSGLISIPENAHMIGTTYFNLPSFTQMRDLFEHHLANENKTT
jgi:hypothetical protein